MIFWEVEPPCRHAAFECRIIAAAIDTHGQAACHLIERVGGIVASCCCVCVMPELQGLQKLGAPCIVLVPFESDAVTTSP